MLERALAPTQSVTDPVWQNGPVAVDQRTLADEVVTALLPPPVVPAHGTQAPLPVARLLASAQGGSLVYAMGRVDASGAVAATQVLDALDWRVGDRIDIRTAGAVIIVRRDLQGLHALPKRRIILMPAVARHSCGIEVGANVLLAAAPTHATLIVHSQSALDRMLALYYSVGTADEPAA